MKVGHAAGVFEVLVQLVARAGHLDVFPEFLAQFRDALERFFQARPRCGPCRIFPTSVCPARGESDVGVRLPLMDRSRLVNWLHVCLRLLEFGMARR